MGNVIDFPFQETTVRNQHSALMAMIDNLETNYQRLDLLHRDLHELEQATDELECDYENALKKYADNVGHENIDLAFLEYSNKAIIKVDADNESVTLQWGNKEPIVLEIDE